MNDSLGIPPKSVVYKTTDHFLELNDDTNYPFKKRSSIDSIIGTHLKDIRRRRNLTLDQLGKLLNISGQQIQKYERGTNSISASKLCELSRQLKIPISFFYEGAEYQLGGQLAEASQDPYETPESFPSDEAHDAQIKELISLIMRLDAMKRAKLVEIFKLWLEEK